jgi:hydrogenase nickel incorporation protein HypA/HybF
MHEVALCRQLAAAVQRAAGPAQVHDVHLDVGALRQVVPETMAYAWPFVVAGTALSRAKLHIRQVPATIRCDGCGEARALGPALGLTCAACGPQASTRIVTGEEFTLVAVDVEECGNATKSAYCAKESARRG